MLLRKLVAKEAPRRSLAPTISREDRSSYCSVGIRLLLSRAGARKLSKDMEQNSEDALGIKRSAEIHSGA